MGITDSFRSGKIAPISRRNEASQGSLEQPAEARRNPPRSRYRRRFVRSDYIRTARSKGLSEKEHCDGYADTDSQRGERCGDRGREIDETKQGAAPRAQRAH